MVSPEPADGTSMLLSSSSRSSLAAFVAFTAWSVSACSDVPECTPADLVAPEDEAAFAVVTSDFSSSAVALLNRDGDLLTEAFVDSGSADALLAATLSGDITLARGGDLTVIDRFGVDTVTLFDTREGGVLAQHSVKPVRAEGPAFRSNPRDAMVRGNEIWVTRYERNRDEGASEVDAGDDVLILDRVTGEPLRSISMTFEGVPGRPDSIVHWFQPASSDGTDDAPGGGLGGLAASGALVGLARLSDDFQEAAPGGYAIIDADGVAEFVPVEGLTNCGEVLRGFNSAIVLCAGATFTDEAGRREGAGFVLVPGSGLGGAAGGSGGEAVIWRAIDHPSVPVPTHGMMISPSASIEDAAVFAVAMGDGCETNDCTPTPDRLVRYDLRSGESEVVYEGSAPFSLGYGELSQGKGMLPDANRGVVVFDGQSLSVERVMDVSPCRGLGAREVRRISVE